MIDQIFISDFIKDLLPEEYQTLKTLVELALDLRWSWNHSADNIWMQVDPELWKQTYNPWITLKAVSRQKIKLLLSNPAFRQTVEKLALRHRNGNGKAWFNQNHPHSPLKCIAYFSMEYMLSEALPIYSGGLGNVAGDQLKSASDLGVPVVGLGLLYQQGYFRQFIDKNGEQQALYPYNDPGQLPIQPLRLPNGEWLRLEIPLPGWSLWLRIWQVNVGNVKLYLLDSNDAANFPIHRGITSELYGGNSELRLKQELLLGIGGWRLLEAIGLKPEVCHLNEGHAAFAVLERALSYMKTTGHPFETALTATRAGTLFTTHTAVPAGFDRFHPDLIRQYFNGYIKKLKISMDDLLALGRQNPNDSAEYFNMAFLAIRGSGSVNGVSKLHGAVSRHIFSPLFPRWPEKEVPVGHVTNGVHMPSWDSIYSDELWTNSCGKERWLGVTEKLEMEICEVPDARLWRMRNLSREALIEYTRERLARQLAARGEIEENVERVKNFFDPNVLTLGFARRFATYKRPYMLLHDPERFIRILTDANRPVQLIIAGKAHPADEPGKHLIKEWMDFITRPEVRSRVVFLTDYDMLMTEHLVSGVDVWINTPRRPWEACGTSGMKVLVNGGLNLSERDGWWAEAYSPKVGWALGDGMEHNEDPIWDAVEANALYDLLEKEVIPEFYQRNAEGIPTEWVAKIRNSMAVLTPRYSANRAVREYTENHYLPAAASFALRTANNGELAVKMVEWQKALKKGWPWIKFENMKVETRDGWHHFEVAVFMNELDPGAITVELYSDVAPPTEMKRVKAEEGMVYIYAGQVPDRFPASSFTPRIVAHHSDVAVPLEASEILWQH